MPWWFSRLRIWCHYCGVGLIPGPGISACCECSQKQILKEGWIEQIVHCAAFHVLPPDVTGKKKVIAYVFLPSKLGFLIPCGFWVSFPISSGRRKVFLFSTNLPPPFPSSNPPTGASWRPFSVKPTSPWYKSVFEAFPDVGSSCPEWWQRDYDIFLIFQ